MKAATAGMQLFRCRLGGVMHHLIKEEQFYCKCCEERVR